MRKKIELHTKFFARTEFIENLGDIFSRFYGYFCVEGDFLREEVDAEDDE
jgi:hypothetical protein